MKIRERPLWLWSGVALIIFSEMVALEYQFTPLVFGLFAVIVASSMDSLK